MTGWAGFRSSLRLLHRRGWARSSGSMAGGSMAGDVEAAERTSRSTTGGTAQWRWTETSGDSRSADRPPAPLVIRAGRASDQPAGDPAA